MEFGPPLGAERVMITLGICRNYKDFGPPRIDVGYGFAPPLTENSTLKHEKGWWLKKGHQKFWEIDDIFGGNQKCRHFFGKRQKKSFKNVGKNLAPRFWSSGSASGRLWVDICQHLTVIILSIADGQLWWIGHLQSSLTLLALTSCLQRLQVAYSLQNPTTLSIGLYESHVRRCVEYSITCSHYTSAQCAHRQSFWTDPWLTGSTLLSPDHSPLPRPLSSPQITLVQQQSGSIWKPFNLCSAYRHLKLDDETESGRGFQTWSEHLRASWVPVWLGPMAATDFLCFCFFLCFFFVFPCFIGPGREVWREHFN